MFRQRHRPAGFINWTDYHWEPSTRESAAGPRPWTGHAESPRRYSFLQVFLAGLAVVAGLQLLSALKHSALRNRGNRSWMERGVLALLLLLVASCVSKQRRR
jgi:hypothetical protein